MKALFIFFIIVIALAIGGGLYANSWYNKAINDGYSDQDAEIVVEEGESFLDVVEKLESEEVIKSALAVRVYLQVEGVDPAIKFGNYTIPAGATVPEIIKILEEGVFEPGIVVTIKEGLTYEEIADVLETELAGTLFNKFEFISIAENPDTYSWPDEIQAFLVKYKPAGSPLRGFLYPDTYEFANDTTAHLVMEKILANSIEKITAEIDLENLALTQDNVTTLYEALTLASIIEKEASKTDDRAEIAGVFHNRLADGITLDSDATVNFFTGKNDAGVLYVDRDTPNPYNTYLNAGLPPTPINNPRIESIIAALYPNETEYYYFIHGTDGKTYFAKTLGEHEENVAKYL